MTGVCFTHDIFSVQQYGGISRYIVELSKELSASTAGRKVEILAGLHINQYLHHLGGVRVRGVEVPALRYTSPARKKINAWLQQRWLKQTKNNTLVHSTYYWSASQWIPESGRKLVLTVHDMISELYPEHCDSSSEATETKKRACQNADHIITVSECTKRDLIRLFGIDEKKITVVYHGNSLVKKSDVQPAEKFDRPYFLYVGSRDGYKNFEAVLQAYSKSSILKQGVFLLCVGPRPSRQELASIESLGLKGSIFFQGGSDADLVAAYLGARALVYPSLYEGFGMPILEAMSLGVPVVSSNSSALMEVGGDSVEYFDTQDQGSLRAVMEEILSNGGRCDELRAAGYERVKKFSWKKSADETSKVYENLF